MRSQSVTLSRSSRHIKTDTTNVIHNTVSTPRHERLQSMSCENGFTLGFGRIGAKKSTLNEWMLHIWRMKCDNSRTQSGNRDWTVQMSARYRSMHIYWCIITSIIICFLLRRLLLWNKMWGVLALSDQLRRTIGVHTRHFWFLVDWKGGTCMAERDVQSSRWRPFTFNMKTWMDDHHYNAADVQDGQVLPRVKPNRWRYR